ncbi:MAG: acetate--CoA ligase family protein [Caulobacterales bacterium]
MEQATTQAPADPVLVLKLDHAIGGYLYGVSQPFLKARLRLDLPSRVDWTCIDEALGATLPEAQDVPPGLSAEPAAGALQRILHWTAQLQSSALDPVLEAGRILGGDGAAMQIAVLALPTTDHTIAVRALGVVVDVINRGLDGRLSARDLVQSVRQDIDRLVETRRVQGRGAADMIKFLEAAHARRIPWLRLGASTAFQIGHGARGRWLDSSFTDATSVIGAKLARNKAAAASVLRQAGVPTPPHRTALSEDIAVRAADQLGYPVVVKPVDRDGGVGVFVRLKTPAAVRKAFGEARKHAETVLVEKFIEGRDYRMVVLHGNLVWALERVPGGVTGDGLSTVRQLVDRLNADAVRGDGRTSGLKRLDLDEEAVDLLAERGMDAGSIPHEGERIRLRGAANVASGGTPVGVFDKVHPDNKLLAERAARALRLDVAGVDLIIPDIGRSWKETGAGVCEVNAQPNIGTTTSGHVYGQILESLIQGDGRIPIALLVADGAAPRAASLVARIMAAAGLRVGLATPDGVSVGDEPMSPAGPDVFAGARLLLGDRAVEAAVAAVRDAQPLSTGMPFDRCTVVALASSSLSDAREGGESFEEVAAALLPLSSGHVVINAADAACMALASRFRDDVVILYAARPDDPGVAAHRARGGVGVWVDPAAGAGRILVMRGRVQAMSLQLDDGGPAEADCGAGDIALAAAVAIALGCGEAHLRLGLAGVRLRPTDLRSGEQSPYARRPPPRPALG